MTKCADCQKRLVPVVIPRYKCPIEEGGCGKVFCGSCLNYSCVTETNSKEHGMKAPITSYCQDCFKKNSSLDFEVNYTAYGPGMGEAPAILFLHRGLACRTMFDYHARVLASRHFRCVLIDFPGHGARMDDTLTLDTACTAIHDALLTLCGNYLGMPPIVVGASLGGYVLIEFVGRYPNLTSGIICTMCGQNVGVNRSYYEMLGLSLLSTLSSLVNSKMIISVLLAEAKRNAQLDEVLVMDSTLRTGVFVDQIEAVLTLFRQSNPRVALPNYKGSVLFINGSKDNRDSEKIWLNATENGELIVYDDGDQYFAHDKRYTERFIEDMLRFIQTVFNR